MIDSMTLAMLAVRLIHFVAVMVLLGGASFRVYACKDIDGTAKVHEIFDQWLWRVFLYAAAVSLLSSVAWLLVQSAIMGGSSARAINSETLSTVLFQTEFGRLWVGRLVLAGLLTIIIMVHDARRSPITGSLTVASLSLLLVASLAGTGHTALANGMGRTVSVTVQAVHLIAAAVWLGGLLPLGYLLQKARRESDSAWLLAAQSALPRYSQAGLVAVTLLVFTGLLISWSLVQGIGALVQTTYGQLLLAKIGLFLFMVGFALVNRLSLMPKVMAGKSQMARHHPPLIMLGRIVAFEQALGVVILALVSVIGTLPPGEDTSQLAYARVEHSAVMPPSEIRFGHEETSWSSPQTIDFMEERI